MKDDLTGEDLARLTEKLHKARLLHSCMTCTHFNHPENPDNELATLPEEQCILYGMRPPAKVIAYGCPSWAEGLPF